MNLEVICFSCQLLNCYVEYVALKIPTICKNHFFVPQNGHFRYVTNSARLPNTFSTVREEEKLKIFFFFPIISPDNLYFRSKLSDVLLPLANSVCKPFRGSYQNWE